MFSDVRVIMFDWGGTLVQVDRQVHTRSRCADACVAFARKLGLGRSLADLNALREKFITAADHHDPEDLREMDTVGILNGWARQQGADGLDGNRIRAWSDAAWTPWVGCLDLIDGARETLNRLADRGIVLGMVSNCATPPAICVQELQRLGIADRLGFTVFSSDVGLRKPHRAIYRAALTKARQHVPDLQPRQVLFAGDTPACDVDGPARMDMQTVLVRTGRWDGDTDALNHPPDAIVPSVRELPGKLAIRAAAHGASKC